MYLIPELHTFVLVPLIHLLGRGIFGSNHIVVSLLLTIPIGVVLVLIRHDMLN